MIDAPPLFVLRHGQTTWNRDGVLQGARDAPLTALGRVQAARQGAILRARGVSCPVYVSPQGRARHSAALAGLDASVETALREVAMGSWEGRRLSDVPAGPGVTWKFAAPGGEDRAAFEGRLRGVLASLRRPSVLVTHGVVSIGLRALLTERDDWDAMADPQGVVHEIAGGVEHELT